MVLVLSIISLVFSIYVYRLTKKDYLESLELREEELRKYKERRNKVL